LMINVKFFVKLFEGKGNRGEKKKKLVCVLKLTMLKPLVIFFSHLRQDSSVTVYNHNV